jgi:type 1 fimbriae regulatory protein FimB/type 1 fimbriae regulatory protein FimE
MPTSGKPKAVRPAPPKARPYTLVRGREHLTPDEVDRLATAAAKLGRHGARDALMIKVAYRHGLRVTELVELRRDQLDLDAGLLHVRRSKRGTPSTHPLAAWEIRGLRKALKDRPEGPYVFTSERKAPLTRNAFGKVVARAGRAAGLAFPAHPHMLRHACGFKLANDGRDTRAIQAYLGHRNIQHTVRYTNLAADRFKTFWGD